MALDYTIYFNNRKFTITSNSDELPWFDASFFYWGHTEPDDIPKLILFLQNHTEVLALFACTPKPDDTMNHFTYNFNHIEAAGGVVSNANNEILLIKRLGRWDLPKGKVEPNETIPAAAIREVTEETGIKNITLEKLLTTTYHTYSLNGKPMLKSTHWFKMHAQINEPLKPQSEEGIEQVKWVKRSDLYVYLANSYASLLSVLEALD